MDVKSMAKNALGSIWGQGGEYEEDFTAGTTDEPTSSNQDRYSAQETAYEDHGGSGQSASLLNGSRRLRPVTHSSRSREKNIYTLRPKNLEEAAVAADCVKSGSAVVINHEMVDRATSLRIVDFMSGVCYGLDNQGHAMKLGETIFLFTPGDYEISSDEVDYGENRDHFFQAEERANAAASASVHQPAVSTHQYASSTPTASTHQYASTAQSSSAPVNPNQAPSPSYSRITIPNDQVASHIGKPHVERRSWER